MIKKVLPLILLLLPLWLSAQDMPFSVKAKTRYSASGMVGYVKVDSVNYFQARLIQEFKYWKIGIGIDLDFLFDKFGHLKKNDWDQLADAIDKIYYIKYGEKDDPFYFHMGGFPSLTEGNGLAMRNYSNMRLYPNLRNTGLMIGGSPHWPMHPSFELFTSNVRTNQILSFAGRFKPLPDSSLKVVDRVMVGFSIVTDRNQYGNLKYLAPDSLSSRVNNLGSRAATIFGFAYQLPLIETEKVTIGTYSEMAHIIDYGTGYILPGVYTNFTFLRVNLEYRIYGKKFTPAFFDRDYEDDRGQITYTTNPLDSTVTAGFAYKEQSLDSLRASQGWSGNIQGLIGKKVKVMFAWQNTFGKDIHNAKYMWFKIWWDTQYKRFENFTFYYNKIKVDKLAITHVTENNAEIGTSLTFRVSKKRWYLIGQYEELYKDRNHNGKIDWLKETKRSVGVGVKYVY